MNKLAQFFGLFLILFGFLLIIWTIVGPGWEFNLPLLLLSFILFIIPGFVYYKKGNKQQPINETLLRAIITKIFVFFVSGVALLYLAIYNKNYIGYGAEGGAIFFGLLFLGCLFIYLIGMIFFIVGVLKKK